MDLYWVLLGRHPFAYLDFGHNRARPLSEYELQMHTESGHDCDFPHEIPGHTTGTLIDI